MIFYIGAGRTSQLRLQNVGRTYIVDTVPTLHDLASKLLSKSSYTRSHYPMPPSMISGHSEFHMPVLT